MATLLKDRVCLITGATGIAAATAAAAVAEGAKVFIVSLHQADCEALASSLRSAGGTCDFAAADLTDEAAVQRAADHARDRFGRIDGLFNVAGISGRRFGDGPLHLCTAQGWDTTLTVNAKTVFLMSRAVLNIMLAQEPREDGQRGSIINTASVLAFSPRADHFATHAYAASKGAILALSQSMAAFYAPQRIRVNAIAPGLVRTPMSQRAQTDQKILDLLKTKQPLMEGFLDASDIANAAVFLLSPQSKGITGTTVTVDAGWSVSG